MSVAAVGADLAALSQKELLDVWEEETVFEKRDKILAELKRRGLFPSMHEYMYEMTTGAYPDAELFKQRGQYKPRDPEFLQKLMARREFADSLQKDWELPSDACAPGVDFELTPVQRFVANFMSPKTPYESALLYHGVGVGKTCAAVQVAENWLDMYPNKKVVIVAPRIIRRGFKKNIFDIERFRFGKTPDSPNEVIGCTGTKYLELSDTLYTRPRAKRGETDYEAQVKLAKDQVFRRVKEQIKRRYEFYGYGAFANYLKDNLLKPSMKISDETARAEDMRERINNEFDGTLLIIDEAHNLRETPTTDKEEPDEDSDTDSPGGESAEEDRNDGKKLTPYLNMVLEYTIGMKLLLMTATPMYNSYREIIFLLNLLLKNDGQAQLNEADIFTKDGSFRENGRENLGLIASRYVSFMRGENPQSFPLRLMPADREPLEVYPTLNPRGGPVDADETIYMEHLPIVVTPLTGDALRAVRHFSNSLKPGKKGISSFELEKIVQAGNLVAPIPAGIEEIGDSDEELRSRVDAAALELHFKRQTVNGSLVFQPRADARWLGEDQLGQYSPKFVKTMDYLKKADGVCFVYTRFVGAGAIPLALALEANGYLPYGREEGLLGGGAVTPGGMQCVLCERRQADHKGVDSHKFTAARYILLTGDKGVSPKNEELIEAEQRPSNVDGSVIKVVIGSAVASEGVDLKYIREIHVLDSWYHLNKTEQIIGRGIRFRSHCALPVEKRNTTIYLHAAVRPAEDNTESGDLYAYRVAFRKGRLVGQVSRVMKEFAVDCNLNHDAIIIQNTDPLRRIVDAQGNERENVSMDDVPFTAVCDWMEECDYKCAVPVDVDPMKADEISYDEYSARWRESKLKKRLRAIMAEQPYVSIERMTSQLLADVPKAAQADLLYKIVGNKKFTVFYNNREGFIIYKNGYYLFQPIGFVDVNIPLALRTAAYPIKVETYQPRDIFSEVMERLKAKRAAIAAAEEAGEKEEAAAMAAEMDAANEEFEATTAPKKEAGRTLEELLSLWEAYVGWFTRLTGHGEARRINKENWPEEVGFFIQERAAGQAKEEERLTNRYEVLQWFAVSCLPWTPEKKATYMKAALELVWDEELGDEDRQTLLMSRDQMPASLAQVVGQHYLTVKLENTYAVTRFLNADTNEMMYYCNKGGDEEPTICDRAVVTYIEKDRVAGDPLIGITIKPATTGSIYGFVTTEKGGYTFKSSFPPKDNDKMKLGEKCDNVSQTNKHRQKIVELGQIMESQRMGNYSLTNEILDKSSRKIVNVKRMCMLFDFTLRYMDAARVLAKRWFYRPLEARKAGHKGKK